MELINTWDQWCAVFNKLNFWQDEIQLICELNQVKPHKIESTFPGTHAVFFINQDIVLKIYCPVRYNSYELELELHNHLLKNNRLFPQILFHGHSPDRYDYIAFTRLNGKPVRELNLKSVSEQTICELAETIIALQSQTLKRTHDGNI